MKSGEPKEPKSSNASTALSYVLLTHFGRLRAHLFFMKFPGQETATENDYRLP